MNSHAAAVSTMDADASDVSGDADVGFTFSALGHDFRAWIQHDPKGDSLQLTCDVGNLPFSAENRSGRRRALVLLSGARYLSSATLMLSDFHKISLLVSERITDPVDPKAILSSAATGVLKIQPLLFLMHACLTERAETGAD